eukprot:GHVN01016777.1.p1 GENE.GHVN01016777.1~~GHVN01016777.1.p1  ORF type:complete len:104 (-),score=5.68 GHVN01016777.1:421-732(-)
MHSFQTELTGSGMRTHADTLRQKMWHVAQRAGPRTNKVQTEYETLLGLMSDREVESVVDVTDRQNDALDGLRKQVEADLKTSVLMQKAIQNSSPTHHRSRHYR